MYGKRQYDSLDGRMRETIRQFVQSLQLLMECVDTDKCILSLFTLYSVVSC